MIDGLNDNGMLQISIRMVTCARVARQLLPITPSLAYRIELSSVGTVRKETLGTEIFAVRFELTNEMLIPCDLEVNMDLFDTGLKRAFIASESSWTESLA
jgi:hypothetical protein